MSHAPFLRVAVKKYFKSKVKVKLLLKRWQCPCFTFFPKSFKIPKPKILNPKTHHLVPSLTLKSQPPSPLLLYSPHCHLFPASSLAAPFFLPTTITIPSPLIQSKPIYALQFIKIKRHCKEEGGISINATRLNETRELNLQLEKAFSCAIHTTGSGQVQLLLSLITNL